MHFNPSTQEVGQAEPWEFKANWDNILKTYLKKGGRVLKRCSEVKRTQSIPSTDMVTQNYL